MVDRSIPPSWLTRGIEEYFPVQNLEQSFIDKINNANKNNRKLRVKLGIDPTEQIFILVTVFYLKNLEHFKIMDILPF